MADGTQFTIDIATKMLGGSAAISQLSELASKLSGAGAASDAAAAALAEGEAHYAALEKNAEKAAKALERAALKSKGSVPADLKQKADSAAAALKGEAVALDALRGKAAAAAAAHTKLAEDVKKAEAAVKSEISAAEKAGGSGKVNEMAEAFGKLGGPLGSTGQQVLGLVEGFGKMGGSLGSAAGAAIGATVAVAALAAAVVAVAAAMAVAVVKTAMWAVGLADANRSAGLAVEALSKTHASLAGLSSLLPQVAANTGLAGDHLGELAKSLAEANVAAGDMPEALNAVALAEAALGKGAAAKFVEELKSGKKTVGELAREMQDKFGGIVAKKMLSLDSQTEKLKKNLAGTFGGLDIEPLLNGLSTLVALFDQNTAMGKALKFVFEGLFQPLIDAATASIPVVEAFLLGLAIGALKIYIAFKPAVKEIKAMFGAADGGGLPSALEVALFLGKALAAAVGMVVVGLGIFAAAIAAPVAGFMQLYAAGATAWNTIKSGAAAAIAFLQSVSLSDIGTKIIQGLADGISGGAATVLNAMKNVVSGAIKGAKSLLGIASPSKVFEGIGGNTAAGFAGGVEDGSSKAQSALESMVSPPAMSGGAGRAGGGPVTITLTVNAPSGDGQDIAATVSRELTRIFEGDVLQLGAGAVSSSGLISGASSSSGSLLLDPVGA